MGVALNKIHEKAGRRASSREEKGEFLKTNFAAGKSEKVTCCENDWRRVHAEACRDKRVTKFDLGQPLGVIEVQ